MAISVIKKKVWTAPTLTEFLKIVGKTRDEWNFARDDVGGPWFRGQQRKHWPLVPNIVRIGCGNRETEDEIREEFAIRAPALSRFETLPTNDWDLYFLMQHYGAPTRLLDWTDSPVGYYDSAVWMLDPYELNRRVTGKREIVAPSAPGANPKDVERVNPWLPPRWTKRHPPKEPIAIFPTHIARRISSQKSSFTVHGDDEAGFSKFQAGKDPCLAKIVVPGYAIRDIRLDLQNYGIDETLIFPDLEGLGRALATSYRDVKMDRPHSRVYVRLRPSKLDKKGVGVFAIRRIPKDTRIFADENEELCWIPKSSLPKGKALRTLYEAFAVIEGDRYGCPTSFNRLTPAWFLNESKKPNTRCDENYDFYTLRNVVAGEELTVDYSTFSRYPGKPSGH
jgi:FRG domain